MQNVNEPAEIVVTGARGTAPMMTEELRAMGFPSPAPLDETALGVRGTLDDTLRLNLHLRSAQRVLLRLATGRARSPNDLYRFLAEEPWENLLHADGYLSITTSIDHPSIRDPRFGALKAKDAIVDRMARACGKRPDAGGERTGAVLHLRWQQEDVAIFLDTSGVPLSRRGYRRNPGAAPMQESLAAACVLATPWRGDSAFVNPMCGSGTLAIEAAWIALQRAPGLLRRNFGFMHVKGYREATWKDMKRAAERAERPAPATPILATDHDPRVLDAARANAEAAGVESFIRFELCDFADTPLPPPPGIIMLNPEYGERMGDEAQLEPVYRRIGDFLKQKAQGYLGYVFTGNLTLAKRIGLHSKRRLILYNSNIECRLLEFELYAGTRNP